MLVQTIGGLMKEHRFLEGEIVAVLQEWQAGAKVVDLVLRSGVSDQTLSRWEMKLNIKGYPHGRLRSPLVMMARLVR